MDVSPSHIPQPAGTAGRISDGSSLMTESREGAGMSARHRTDLVRPLPELLRGQKNPFVMVVPTEPVASREGGR
ncbi:hypothetical protein GCM10017771_89570 [Streptomyces capitiformicae]|uniref:Uncharacterized protein n=1 Tax=Streptomyces capitiformicae TaxID=2014920 RepID=A0A918ZS88_9ACTN|nr:hypothetical protein GCM10017771_89570 [Streptomyces capitiformicae]